MVRVLKDMLDLIEPAGEVKGDGEVVSEEVSGEFVVMSTDPLTLEDRAELSKLGYDIFYENDLVTRLFCVRNVEGSVDELDGLAFVEKASASTTDRADSMNLGDDA